MQIIFAGIPLASEPYDGGTDGVLGFALPVPAQIIQDIDAIRAADSYPQARGNRKRTISGTIWRKPATTLAEAMLLRQQWYESLSWQGGALVLTEDTTITTFAVAVLEKIDIADNTEGVGYGLAFTFRVGPPSFTSNPSTLKASTGNSLLYSTGKPIQT
jgi:hypothetical protein